MLKAIQEGEKTFEVKTSNNNIKKEKKSKMNEMQVNSKKVDAPEVTRVVESHWEKMETRPKNRLEKMNVIKIEQARALKYSYICECIKDQMTGLTLNKSMDDEDARNYFLDLKRMAIRLIDVTNECETNNKEEFSEFIDALILIVLFHDEQIPHVTDFIRGCLGIISSESCESILLNTCSHLSPDPETIVNCVPETRK